VAAGQLESSPVQAASDGSTDRELTSDKPHMAVGQFLPVAFWRSYTARITFSPKHWSDAYLSAFAQTASGRLVSCEKGFSQIEKLNSTILV
jgi:predicted nucleic acid-binding protein